MGQGGTLFSVSIRFPVGIAVIVGGFVFVLTVVFYVASGLFTQTIIFFGAATAAGATTLVAFYTARTLSLYLAQETDRRLREEALALQGKKECALRYAERWNDPTMFHVRDVVRGILDLRGQDEQKLQQFVEEKKTNVIHILNYVEELAFALDHGLVDADLLRNQFEGIVIGLWQVLEPWISKHRKDRARPKIWERVENLYIAWK